MESRDKSSIVNQIYEKQLNWVLFYEDYNFCQSKENAYLNYNSTLHTTELIQLGLIDTRTYFHTLFQIIIIKIQTYLLSYIWSKKFS